MMQNYIKITGARENNLKNVSLKIPKQKITVFTGISGAGKSSLVFDTIAAESQRQLNETFTTFVQNYLPKYGQPEVDAIENLSAAVIINQKQIKGNSRSTVGTITDTYSLLRLLYSRIGKPHIGYSNAFSFNDPEGRCPECDGIGEVRKLDLEKLLDKSKSLNEGAIRFRLFGVGSYQWKIYARSGLFDSDKKLADYTTSEWEKFLHGASTSVELSSSAGTVERDYEGLIDKFTRLYIKRDISSLSKKNREAVEQVLSTRTCPLCNGARLSQDALSSKIQGYNIAELASIEIHKLVKVLSDFQNMKEPVAAPILSSVIEGLGNLVSIGLGYLTLNRETMTLSGGEAQRIKMVKQLGSSLTDMIYIFDEPTIGLHPVDIQGLNGLLRKLRDKGNTVLVVEHDPDVIEIADHTVDIGPQAGTHGGEVVYQGDFEGLREARTLTGKYLRLRRSIKSKFRQPAGQMPITNASLHNLQNITVNIPKGILTVVTGVAGAGKSTLINDVFLEDHSEAIVVDQSAVHTSIRSVPATYTGMMDDIRDLFAQSNEVSNSLFSFNSEGACPKCEGRGIMYTDLAFMEPVKSMCEACGGKRFKEDVLDYTFRGKSINEVLDMTTSEALDFFEEAKLRNTLRALRDVGLGYLTLGQPLNTLSGGECQRIKLASELHKSGSIYVMDEPTTGLHMSDLDLLLSIMDRLVDEGNSVIIIEHNLEIVKNADWIIDLGPGGGSQGGKVVFEGTPQQLLKNNSTTAEYLQISAV